MTYLQRNNRKKKKKFFIFFIVSALIIFSFSFFNIVFPKTVVNYVAYPILKTKNFVSQPFSGITNYFRSKSSLIQENEDLKRKIAQLNLDALTFGLIEKEFKELKNNFNLGNGNDRILSNVLIRPPYSPYDTFIIDVGEDRVSVGDSVYHSGIKIGSIGGVGQKTSIVKLISSSGNRFQININKSINAEANGQGGGKFISIIPKDTKVEIGDIITIPELSSNVFATVQAIDSTHTDTFKIVFFNTPIDLFNISFVEVSKDTIADIDLSDVDVLE